MDVVMDNENNKENSGKEIQRKNTGNLKPWKPGQSGNPAGKPKGAKDGIQARLKRLLNKKAPDKAIALLKENFGYNMEDSSNLEAMLAMLLFTALSSSASNRIAAAKLIFEQLDEAGMSKLSAIVYQVLLPDPAKLSGPVIAVTPNEVEEGVDE